MVWMKILQLKFDFIYENIQNWNNGRSYGEETERNIKYNDYISAVKLNLLANVSNAQSFPSNEVN